MEIELNKSYTLAELQNIKGEDFIKTFGRGIPKIVNKKIISKFDDFDNDTKKVYTDIYNLIKNKNPNQKFELYATGSRVKGYWRTNEEADNLALEYGFKPKYSDYDCCTNANIKPTKDEFKNALGVVVDFCINSDVKILIVANETESKASN